VLLVEFTPAPTLLRALVASGMLEGTTQFQKSKTAVWILFTGDAKMGIKAASLSPPGNIANNGTIISSDHLSKPKIDLMTTSYVSYFFSIVLNI
jgi:hypothetical protein